MADTPSNNAELAPVTLALAGRATTARNVIAHQLTTYPYVGCRGQALPLATGPTPVASASDPLKRNQKPGATGAVLIVRLRCNGDTVELADVGIPIVLRSPVARATREISRGRHGFPLKHSPPAVTLVCVQRGISGHSKTQISRAVHMRRNK